MRVRSTLLVACAAISLSGCATQVIGTITLSNISSIAGIASTLATGQDLGEHALSLIMGKDCRFSEALLTDERDVCEEHGSPRTKDDFQGILIAGKDAEGNVVRGAPEIMSASDGSIGEDGSIEPVLVRIKGVQHTQYAEAEMRVAERTRQANEALLAFASDAPATTIAMAEPPRPVSAATTAVAEYKSVISGPVVVISLAPLKASEPVAVAQAETSAPAVVASTETPAPIQVVNVTPVRKPVEFQVASAEVETEIATVAPVAAATPVVGSGQDTQVADASLFSGTRLVVPLKKQVTLISASASDAGASLMQPVAATLANAPAPYVVNE